jgi:GTP-binding protein
MAQTKARPPTFVLFSSRADQMPDHYRRYLINSLRESFDLPGVPLRITIKSGANPYADGEAKGHSGRGKREFERREREEERIRASRNTVKKSKRIADEAAAKAAIEAGLPDPREAKPVKKKAPAVPKAAPALENAVAAEPGKAAVKSVKKLGPKVQKKVSTTPSYKVGAKSAGGKAAGPKRPVSGARTVRGNTGPGKPKR